MKRAMVAAVLGIFLWGPALVNAKDIDVKEGRWEITTKIEMEGMPMDIPATTVSQCITKKDVVPQKAQPGEDCMFKNTAISGNTVTWSVVCNSKDGAMESEGTVTYQGGSFDGSSIIRMKSEGSTMQMRARMKGKRVGDCN